MPTPIPHVSVADARVLVEAGIREAFRSIGHPRADVASLVDQVIDRLVGPGDDCDDRPDAPCWPCTLGVCAWHGDDPARRDDCDGDSDNRTGFLASLLNKSSAPRIVGSLSNATSGSGGGGNGGEVRLVEFPVPAPVQLSVDTALRTPREAVAQVLDNIRDELRARLEHEVGRRPPSAIAVADIALRAPLDPRVEELIADAREDIHALRMPEVDPVDLDDRTRISSRFHDVATEYLDGVDYDELLSSYYFEGHRKTEEGKEDEAQEDERHGAHVRLVELLVDAFEAGRDQARAQRTIEAPR